MKPSQYAKCKHPGCGNAVYAKELCVRHYFSDYRRRSREDAEKLKRATNSSVKLYLATNLRPISYQEAQMIINAGEDNMGVVIRGKIINIREEKT